MPENDSEMVDQSANQHRKKRKSKKQQHLQYVRGDVHDLHSIKVYETDLLICLQIILFTIFITEKNRFLNTIKSPEKNSF